MTLQHHQLEKLKPLINLVDNMVKLGSTSTSSQQHRRHHQQTPMTLPQLPNRPAPIHPPMGSMGSRWIHQSGGSHHLEPPTYSNVHQLRSSANGMLHPIQRSSSGPQTPVAEDVAGVDDDDAAEWQEEQLAQLDAKHHQLGQLEKFVREEGAGNLHNHLICIITIYN